MEELYEEWFQSMGQFRKLRILDMFPKISELDYYVMAAIFDKEKEKKITISEVAAKTHALPQAVSRTLRGLEEKGYVERMVNQKDRRNTYVELTEEGRYVAEKTRHVMSDFGCAVMSQVDEEDMRRMITYMNNIYHIAEKEIQARKWVDRKEREDE